MFKTGSLVWLRNSARECKKGDKLKPRWLGPYKVVECLGKKVLKIANAKTGEVTPFPVAANRAKNCKDWRGNSFSCGRKQSKELKQEKAHCD